MISAVSPAKLNLFLEVTGRREDGFHNLDSVFLELDLADRLSAATDAPGRFSLDCAYPGLPSGDGNLVVRAAKLLAAEAGAGRNLPGIRFSLEKRIPPGGGLGGGSSNTAAALRLADRLWRLDLPDARLAELGARLGSDVPFFFQGGLCRCRGRGELVTPLPAALVQALPRLCLVLSDLHSDTAAAFRGLRLPPGPGAARRADGFIQALETGDPEAMAAAAFNRFDATVTADLPELSSLRDCLGRTLSRGPWLSGSGASLWFFGAAEETLSRLAGDAEWLRLSERLGVRLLDAVPAERR
jgi:4-diphosphocytidyl-2-C-methyl-D-erythritol kinase